jgi:hypothetical protein
MGDGAAYYFTATPYRWGDEPNGAGAYRYSPAFLYFVAPLRVLPWEVFAGLWFAAHVGVLLYFRIGWVLILPPVMEDALWGNTSLFLGVVVAMIVSGRTASLWAAVLLTKVTPGVAMVWHAARREWRRLGEATAVTLILVGIGLALDSRLWVSWVESLVMGPATYDPRALGGPLLPRLVIAAALAVLAARSNKPWLLPVAVLLALPGIWPHSLAILVGSVLLWRMGAEHRLESSLQAVPMAVPEAVPIRVADAVPVPVERPS